MDFYFHKAISSPLIGTKSFWASQKVSWARPMSMVQKAKFSSEKSQVVIRVGFYN